MTDNLLSGQETPPNVTLLIANTNDEEVQILSDRIGTYKSEPSGIYVSAATRSASDLIEVLSSTHGDGVIVAFLDTSALDIPLADAVSRCRAANPDAHIVISTWPDEIDPSLSARLGVEGILVKQFRMSDAIQLFQRIALRARTTRRCIAVHCPKSGEGASLTALNLALALRQMTDVEVGLLDLDLQFGNQDILLAQTNYSKTIADVLAFEQIDSLEPKTITQQMMYTHPTTNLRVLFAPHPNDEVADQPTHVADLVRYLREQFTYLVLDTSHNLSDNLLTTMLPLIDLMLVVITPDSASVRAAQRYLTWLAAGGLSDKQTMLILNRFRPGVDSAVIPEIEGFLQRRIEAAILYDRDRALDAVNRAKVLANGNWRDPVARNFLVLAAILEGRRSGLPSETPAMGKK